MKKDLKKGLLNTLLNSKAGTFHVDLSPGRPNTDEEKQSPIIPKWIQQLRDLSPEDKKSLQEKIRKSLKESNSENTE